MTSTCPFADLALLVTSGMLRMIRHGFGCDSGISGKSTYIRQLGLFNLRVLVLNTQASATVRAFTGW